MKPKKPISSFAPHEIRRFILPISLASICIVTCVILENILNSTSRDIPLIIYASIVIIYTLLNNVLVARASNFRETYGWFNSILTGIGLGLLSYFLPDYLDETSHVLIVFGIVAVATVSGRLYAYLSLLIALHLPSDSFNSRPLQRRRWFVPPQYHQSSSVSRGGSAAHSPHPPIPRISSSFH